MKSPLDRIFPDPRSVLLDGAMATALFQQGWPRQMATVLANVEAGEWVTSVHAAHKEAGARVLQTNTFGVLLGAEDRQADVARAAVTHAKAAAGGDVAVAGALAGYDLRFHGPRLDEVVTVLVGEGVDLLVFETCNTVDDARAALDAAHRLAPSLPVIVCATTTDGGHDDQKRVREIMALLAAEADEHVQAGLNCCRGPYDALRMAMSLPTMPLWIKPSIGAGDDAVNDHVMAAFARAARIHGARYIGGCCGTTPETLATMAAALNCLDG